MRSTKNKSEFFTKMNKKKAVQEVMDNIEDYSVDDINNLRGNQFPKWIREELVKYKERGGIDIYAIAEHMASLMPKNEVVEEEYEVYQYVGNDDLEIGDRLKLTLSAGDYIMRLKDDFYKVNNYGVKKGISESQKKYPPNSEYFDYIGKMPINMYLAKVKELIEHRL